jgi:hypothetical protein
MSVHNYSSWGRTRRPKNITGKDGHYATGSGVAEDGAVGGLPALTAIGAGTPDQGVYKTENQRYMHMHCSGSNSGITNVYTYNYAAACWSELMTGSAGSAYGSVQCGENQHRIVDIQGADLVSVVTGSSSKLPYANYLAFSTF